MVILMTASVSTRGMKGAQFDDAERENMYLETLMFYSHIDRTKNLRIVFVENSGWNLAKLKSNFVENDFIEFISLDPSLFDISKGKGYNELLLIDKALETSKILKNAVDFVKVTGRYPILNIESFLNDFYKTECDIY